jgi:integrase
MILTIKDLENLQGKKTDDGFDPDGKLDGSRLKGSLIFKRPNGRSYVDSYLRMRGGGADITTRIGTWTAKGEGKTHTLSEIRKLALELALRYAVEGVALKGNLEAEREAEQQARVVDEEKAKQDNSLGALLIAYIDDMRHRGRRSADDVERMFRSRIEVKHPDLWSKPANTITKDDLMGILGGMVDDGITRRVNMMRSCLKTAFEFGIGMADDMRYSTKAKVFELGDNPAARIKRRTEFDKAGERVLTPIELGRYLQRIDDVESVPVRAFLQLHIRLGGQRIEQLLRVKWTDIREGTLRIIDEKGKGDPREHVLPLSAADQKTIATLKGISKEWVFSTNGEVHMRPETITSAVRAICQDMIDDEEAKESFTASDLRRTAETLLASIGVDKDTRTELLSHGRNSLVSRHYDKYEYLPAKKDALAKWSRALSAWKKGKTTTRTTKGRAAK